MQNVNYLLQFRQMFIQCINMLERLTDMVNKYCIGLAFQLSQGYIVAFTALFSVYKSRQPRRMFLQVEPDICDLSYIQVIIIRVIFTRFFFHRSKIVMSRVNCCLYKRCLSFGLQDQSIILSSLCQLTRRQVQLEIFVLALRGSNCSFLKFSHLMILCYSNQKICQNYHFS